MSHEASVEYVDIVLVEYESTPIKQAVVDFCMWSSALDCNVITRAWYRPLAGLAVLVGSGDPACDYFVVTSEQCLADAKELCQDQRKLNEQLN